MAVNALIEAGETVLRDNRFPSAGDLSLVTSNASTGHDLMLLGMATDCVRSLRDTHQALTQIQGTLIKPEIIANLDFDQRIVLTRTLLEMSKHQHGFLKDVHERVNIQSLHSDMLANDPKIKRSDGLSKEEKKVIRETLHKITQTTTYRTDGNGQSVDADVVEINTETDNI